MSSIQVAFGGRILQRYHKLIGQFLLFAFLVGYWLYAWQLERITYEQVPPNLWNQIVTSYPLFSVAGPFVLFLIELFSPRVLRHLIPIFVGFWMARITVNRFLESFYDLADQSAAKSLLSRLMNLGPPNRFLGSLGHENTTTSIRQNSQLRVGGPGFILVTPGSAMLTELNGHVIQVYGPDSHALSRFESPRAVLDLRPQERTSEEIDMVTSDGIDITVTIRITFQIDSFGQPPTKEQPYPFNNVAARNAMYAETNMSEGQLAEWDELTLEVAVSELTRIVNESRLDELLTFEKHGIHPHPQMSSELRQRVRKIMQQHGVEIRDIQLGRFDLPDPVVHETIRYWQSYWERKRRNDIEQEEETAETLALANKQAKARIAALIARELHRVQRQGMGVRRRPEVALRLINELVRSLDQLDGQTEITTPIYSRLSTLKRRLQSDKADLLDEEDLPKLTDG